MSDKSSHAATGAQRDRWSDFVAVTLGCAVPSLVLGRAALALMLVPSVIAGLLTLRRHGVDRPSPGSMLGIAVIVTAVAWLLSSIMSIDPVKSLGTWARTLAMVAYGCVLVSYLRSQPRGRSLCLRTLIGAGAAALVIATTLIYGDPELVRRIVMTNADNFNAPQAFKAYGSAAACMLPVVLWGGWRLGGLWKVLAVVTVPLTLLLLYGKGNQVNDSGYFGLAGAAVLIAVILGLGRLSALLRWLVVAGIAVAILAGAAYVLVNLPSPPVTADQAPPLPFPDWHRQVIWGFARDAFLDAPIFGVGPNTINYLPGAHAMVPGLNQEYIPSHPHNWVLEIATETGIVGVLGLSAALLLWLRVLAVRALGGSGAAWTALSVLGVFWVSALGNFSIWSAWWLMSLIVFVSLPISVMLSGNERANPAKDRPT